MELLIGTALIRWNFISQRELEAGLSLASLTNLPLGKSMCALNLLTETELRSSIEVQSMLRDGLLSEQESDRVMHLCRVKQVSLNRALAMTGLISLSGQRVRLGQLLCDLDYISQAELSRALQISQRTGLPLGSVLINCDLVEAEIVETVIRYQRTQRLSGKLCDLQTLKKELAKLPGAIGTRCSSDSRLGQLLREGDIVSKTELMAALEISFINQRFLGELLVELAWIKEATLTAALELQRAVRDGRTDFRQAVRILRQVHLNETTLEDVLQKQLPNFIRNLSFERYLTVSRIADADQIVMVQNEYLNSPSSVPEHGTLCGSADDAERLGDALCRAEVVAGSVVTEAIRYWQFVRQGLMPLVRAIALLAQFAVNEEQMQRANLHLAHS